MEKKTTIPDHVMNQISNIIEEELKEKEIYYIRNGTEFKVNPDNLKELYDAQMKANTQLINKGVITLEMLRKDVKANF